MHLTLWQLRADGDEAGADRLDRVESLVRTRRETDLVVLPELWFNGAFTYDRWVATAEPIDGPLVARMSASARAAGVHLHMGSFVERDGDELFNTSVVIGPDGAVLETYRKIHLFGFSAGEPELMTAGTSPAVWASPWGTIGLTTCYDLRFPELYRSLVDLGAELVLVVAGWPGVRVAHWSVLARARAIENQFVVAALNTVGRQGRTVLGGCSVVVDATGIVLAEAQETQTALEVDVDLADVTRWRTEFPVLADRRIGGTGPLVR